MKEVNTLDLKSNAERLESSSLSSSTKEEWLPVVGHETVYAVSNKGGFKRIDTDRLLKQVTNKKGYKTVASKIGGRNGKDICFRVHREVAKAFLENPDNKSQINHKDGNKANNFVENLEWCTPKENTRHAFETGLARGKPGDSNPNCKILDSEVLEIFETVQKTRKSLRSICKERGITHSTVSRRFVKLKGR